jgi:pyruvate/2-oxoglutarate dehydrogenase complex dihydrolipoamide acyltransferase (E2) component
MPLGVLNRWVADDGALVQGGERIAEIRIEGSLHEITAPIKGRLTRFARTDEIVQPGSVLGQLSP